MKAIYIYAQFTVKNLIFVRSFSGFENCRYILNKWISVIRTAKYFLSIVEWWRMFAAQVTTNYRNGSGLGLKACSRDMQQQKKLRSGWLSMVLHLPEIFEGAREKHRKNCFKIRHLFTCYWKIKDTGNIRMGRVVIINYYTRFVLYLHWHVRI